MTALGTKSKEIHLLRGARKVLLWPLCVIMRLWTRTLRLRMDEETRRCLTDTREPTILLFWHNRLFIAAEVYRRLRRGRTTYCLISASRDGAWLAAFMELGGLRTVRGSSSRRGREALDELGKRLKEGSDVGITPDGPRGPLYSFKAGAPLLASRTGARALLINADFSRAWRLRSWDRFVLPKPFSIITLRAVMEAGNGESPESPAERAGRWRALLLELGPVKERA